MKYWTMFLEVLIAGSFVFLAVTLSMGIFSKPTQPGSFDSMLCRVHTPTAALLINDELITCTNGKKYRVTKNQ
jgi:hypothetical protein